MQGVMTAAKHATVVPASFARAAVVITCEHGGNQIPAPYQALFAPYQGLLETHRGFDAGALVMAQALALACNAPLLSATVSRLLVDLNRSIGHPHLHFDPILDLPASQRQDILKHHYQPYRTEAERLIDAAIAAHGQVIHLSSHSFTPELNGERRNADIGLLYDPARPSEKALCAQWKHALEVCAPEWVVRRNYPYQGRNDGLTRTLRKRHPPEAYIGIELELNQKHVTGCPELWAALRKAVIESLLQVLAFTLKDPTAAPCADRVASLSTDATTVSGQVEGCAASPDSSNRITGVST